MPRKKTPFIQKKHSNTYSISAGHNDFIDEKYASQGSIQKPEENGSETGARKTVPAYFEGGQIPLYRRIPKVRGIGNASKMSYVVVSGVPVMVWPNSFLWVLCSLLVHVTAV